MLEAASETDAFGAFLQLKMLHTCPKNENQYLKPFLNFRLR